MIKKASFAMFLLLILVFSISTIQAGDVNVTDVALIDSNENIDLQLEDNSQVNDEGVDNSLDYDGIEALHENSKNQTQLVSPTDTGYYNGNYEVTLIDSNNNAKLVNKPVNFLINNVIYSAKTNANGVAIFNFKLNPGTYTVISYFEGDDNYCASDNLSSQFKILPTINANDVVKYYKGSTPYKATYLDGQGNALKNKMVTITVNGKKYTKKTNNNGVASFSLNFKPGTYKVTTTNPSNGYKLTTTFKILTTISTSDLKKVKGDNNKFVAKFFKSNGNPLSNKYVKFKIKGKIYKYKTNSKGEVKLSFNSFKKGTYKVISYNGDGLSRTKTVQIYNIATTKITTNSYTFLLNDTKEIKIKFSTNLNDNSKAGKVIRITIGGLTYSQKTNANGEIKFKLPSLEPGLYTFDCEYAGNKFFKNSYAYKYITILDTSDTKLKVKSNTSFGDYSGTPFKVALTAGDVPLIGKAVKFDVNGKSYTATTDNWGIASLPINLGVGNYAVNYQSFDDSKVNGTSGSCSIEVFKRTNTKLVFNIASSYKDSSQTFKVLLTDGNGTPMANREIELVIDDEIYYKMTNSNGYVTFKTNLACGKYKFVIRFAGNEDYKSCSVSKSINVKISKYVKGINEKDYSVSSSYLKSTRYCQVNNAKIKSLVKSLTKGLTNKIDKAKAIFNYVKNNIVYSYYYNSKLGATGTLKAKCGNCVDQAHLLIAMYRAAGFKARYVHGKCKFYDDGQYYGHVWTQVLVDNTWICGDPISYSNQFGKINNWNVKNYKLRSTYLSLPF